MKKSLKYEENFWNDKLEYLYRAGSKLTRQIELSENEIIHLVQEMTSKFIKIENMYIALYNSMTDSINFGLSIEEGVQQTVGEGKWISRINITNCEIGKTETVIIEKKPLLINTLKDHIEWYEKPGRRDFKPRAISWLGVPMIVGDRTIGMISIYDLNNEYKYKDHYVQFMTTLADQAAAALNNARLFKESADRIKDLEIISQIGEEIHSMVKMNDILDAIIIRIVTQLKCNHCTIFLPKIKQNQKIYLVSHITKGKYKTSKPFFDTDSGLVGAAYTNGGTILCENVYDDPRFVITGERAGNFRSMLLVPIIIRNNPIAVICADHDEFAWFDDSHRYFVEVLARQAGIAFENASLYQKHECDRKIIEQNLIIAKMLSHGMGTNIVRCLDTCDELRKSNLSKSDIKLKIILIRNSYLNIQNLVGYLIGFQKTFQGAFEKFNIRTLIEDIVQCVRYEVEEIKQIYIDDYATWECDVVITCSNNSKEITGSRHLLWNAIENILLNAMYAMKKHIFSGKIKIDINTKGNKLKIIISNDGPPISNQNHFKYIQKLFDSKNSLEHIIRVQSPPNMIKYKEKNLGLGLKL